MSFGGIVCCRSWTQSYYGGVDSPLLWETRASSAISFLVTWRCLKASWGSRPQHRARGERGCKPMSSSTTGATAEPFRVGLMDSYDASNETDCCVFREMNQAVDDNTSRLGRCLHPWTICSTEAPHGGSSQHHGRFPGKVHTCTDTRLPLCRRQA